MKLDKQMCECRMTHPSWFGPSIRDVPQVEEYYDLVWFFECGACKVTWLRVLFEAPHLPKAGHWYDALVNDGTDDSVMSLEEIAQFTGTRTNIGLVFSRARTKFRGGSYFGGVASPTDLVPTRLVE